MNFKQLRYFLAVAEEGSFSAASRRVRIAQPALSGHIAALEDELGVKLFERSNRGVRTTSQGRRLAEHARNILRQLDNARSDVSGDSADPGGEVMIAIPYTAAYLLAGEVNERVEREFPRITLKLFEGLSHSAGDIMGTGKVDLGVVPNAEEIDNLEVQPLFLEDLYLVGKWDGSGPRDGEIDFADLTNYPLALGSRLWNLRRTIEHTALSTGVQLNIRYEVPGTESLISMIKQGLCCTITNWAGVQRHLQVDELFALKIVNPQMQRTISLAWPKDRPMTDAVEGVRRILRDVLLEKVSSGEWRAEPLE